MTHPTIDWSTLSHAYGDATSLPESLEALRSPSADTASALEAIANAVVHQYTVYSASGPALIALVGLLPQVDAALRRQIVDVLGRMAWSDGERQAKSAVKAAFKEVTPTLVELVGEADREVRIGMGRVVAGPLAASPKLTAAATASLAKENDLGILMALAVTPTLAKGKPAPARVKLASKFVASADVEKQVVGALSLAVALRASAPESVIAPLVVALEKIDSFTPAIVRTFWSSGRALVDVASALSLLAPAQRQLTVPPLCAALRRGTDVARIAESLHSNAFGAEPAPSSPDALSAPQREALQALIASAAAWEGKLPDLFEKQGWPCWREAMAEWLGHPVEGPLEREVTLAGKCAPLWQHIDLALERRASKDELSGTIVELSEQPGDMTTVDWLVALGCALKNARGLRRYRKVGEHSRRAPSFESEWEALFERLLAEDKPAAERFIRETLEAEYAAADRAGASSARARLVLDAWALAQLGDLPERYDFMLDMSWPGPRHRCLPISRLEALLIPHLAREAEKLGEPKPGRWPIGFKSVSEIAERFLEERPSTRIFRAMLGLRGISGMWHDNAAIIERAKSEPLHAASAAEYVERTEGLSNYPAVRKALVGFIDEVRPPPL